MGVKVYLSDPKTGREAEVIGGKEEKHALIVATRPLKTFENSIRFFANPDYGADMNINAAASGTPVQVHNGTDTALWAGTQEVGGADVVFDSGDQNHTAAGAKSIYFNRLELNDTVQFDKGSGLDLTSYSSLTLWIYVDNNWGAIDSFSLFGWDTGTSSIIGSAVNLENYFSYLTQDVWQKISIPLRDMDLVGETIDALRIACIGIGGVKPKFYIDDIQFEEKGVPVSFSIEADKGTWLHVNEFAISVANARASTLADGTMPNIPYNGLLGETLTSGITYKRIQGNDIEFSTTILDLIGLLELAGTEISGQGSDGTNTWLTISVKHQEPLILKAEVEDKLQWTVSEDLTGLVRLRISAGCSIEVRE